MTLFKQLKISTSNSITGSSRKKIEKELGVTLEKDVKQFKCKKIILLGEEGNLILFNWSNKWIYTLNYLRNQIKEGKDLPYPKIFIDDGAMAPIKRGCDIFKPGITKYKEKITVEFIKNDILILEVINYGIFALVQALIDYNELDMEKGTGFKVLTCEGDELDSL
ncbi:RNA-binding protein with PUA domain [Pseudoloma neurophilia]|uniref:RNA-binding protein with PUA domain n=1 Tax=Pseudoloma neurophilia TaxID=146866 RepID=A0A0R0M4V7_9MICR|nr:RNA-binding protein with PUA domain [Pseudoloma neurophilia]